MDGSSDPLSFYMPWPSSGGLPTNMPALTPGFQKDPGIFKGVPECFANVHLLLPNGKNTNNRVSSAEVAPFFRSRQRRSVAGDDRFPGPMGDEAGPTVSRGGV